MLGLPPKINAFIRTLALTTLGALAAVSSAQAAISPIRSARLAVPSPMWTLSHLNMQHLRPRPAAAGVANATTSPLYGPWGITVAANGDLYVANLLANQVLVYDTNLNQKTRSTITTNLSHPTSVAFDSTGEVYVSNINSNAITVYSANHVYLPNRTIVSNINTPVTIAIDGLNDLYVDDKYSAVAVYDFLGSFVGNLALQANLGTVNWIAQGAQRIAFAGPSQVQVFTTVSELEYIPTGISPGGNGINANYATCVAFDANGNLYMATDDPEIYFYNTTTNAQSLITKLTFPAAGIAVDSQHGRVFVSDYYDNAIAVYSLTGKLLTTLH